MQTDITAWYDEKLRSEILKNISEVYYYMVHATHTEERRHWAMEYTKFVEEKNCIRCGLIASAAGN